jgi:hypothetical protein
MVSPDPLNQFQRLLELQEQANWSTLETQCSQLLEQGLEPHQRALVLQLQAQACLVNGTREQAAHLLKQALGYMFLPQAALQWLAVVIPEWVWQEPDRQALLPAWVEVSRQLVRQGFGDVLLRSLMGLFAQLPLEGQREALVLAIEHFDALQLEQHPQLQRQWILLRQAAAGGGDGCWA